MLAFFFSANVTAQNSVATPWEMLNPNLSMLRSYAHMDLTTNTGLIVLGEAS